MNLLPRFLLGRRIEKFTGKGEDSHRRVQKRHVSSSQRGHPTAEPVKERTCWLKSRWESHENTPGSQPYGHQHTLPLPSLVSKAFSCPQVSGNITHGSGKTVNLCLPPSRLRGKTSDHEVPRKSRQQREPEQGVWLDLVQGQQEGSQTGIPVLQVGGA